MQIQRVMSPQRAIESAGGYGEEVVTGVGYPIYDEDLQPSDAEWLPVNARTCNRIVCGFMNQDEAGIDLLYACSRAGFTGARAGCKDPFCQPYTTPGECDEADMVVVEGDQYFTMPTADFFPFDFPPVEEGPPETLRSPMPSITPVPGNMYQGSPPIPGCGFSGWVADNPGLAVAALVAAFLMMKR